MTVTIAKMSAGDGYDYFMEGGVGRTPFRRLGLRNLDARRGRGMLCWSLTG